MNYLISLLILLSPDHWHEIDNENPPPLGQSILLYANAPERYLTREPKIFVGKAWNTPQGVGYESAWGDGYLPFDYKLITHWKELPWEPLE